MATVNGPATTGKGFIHDLNTKYHRVALWMFLAVVIAHWAEHLTQAVQVWVLDWPRPQARGVLGVPFPWLVSSEWMHYAYAIVMLVGLFLLLPGFVGRARTWWLIALGLQFWHHIEHLLLLIQALTGSNLADKPVPTSIAQLVFPRVELHLFYNVVVFIPMVVAMYLHSHPTKRELKAMTCSCPPQRRALAKV
ncbi:MAG TPA: hypothetical protein VGD67_22100 [Pseudonocardiaceae bacterium]